MILVLKNEHYFHHARFLSRYYQYSIDTMVSKLRHSFMDIYTITHVLENTSMWIALGSSQTLSAHIDWVIYIIYILLENTYSTRIVWKKKQTWQTTVNELRPFYRLWLCRWGIHDSADLRSRHQHQAHASSDIGETGQRTTGWGDLPRVPYAPCPSPDSNPHAYAYESKLWTMIMRPPRAPYICRYLYARAMSCARVHVWVMLATVAFKLLRKSECVPQFYVRRTSFTPVHGCKSSHLETQQLPLDLQRLQSWLFL